MAGADSRPFRVSLSYHEGGSHRLDEFSGPCVDELLRALRGKFPNLTLLDEVETRRVAPNSLLWDGDKGTLIGVLYEPDSNQIVGIMKRPE